MEPDRPTAITNPLNVYRAVSPTDIDPFTDRVEPRAFFLRKGEQSLSVFSADQLTPRDVLQRIVEGRFAELSRRTGKEREKYLSWLERHGDTVEGLVRAGWRVARLPISAFDVELFQIGEVEPDGHISIGRDATSFDAYSLDWITFGLVELVPIE